MTKAVIQFGYDKYVVSAEDALTLHGILAKAERYKAQWRSKEDGGTTYHVWDQDAETESRNIEILPDNLYRLAKLAGKPEDK